MANRHIATWSQNNESFLFQNTQEANYQALDDFLSPQSRIDLVQSVTSIYIDRRGSISNDQQPFKESDTQSASSLEYYQMLRGSANQIKGEEDKDMLIGLNQLKQKEPLVQMRTNQTQPVSDTMLYSQSTLKNNILSTKQKYDRYDEIEQQNKLMVIKEDEQSRVTTMIELEATGRSVANEHQERENRQINQESYCTNKIAKMPNMVSMTACSEIESKQHSTIQHRGKNSGKSISPENIEDSDEQLTDDDVVDESEVQETLEDLDNKSSHQFSYICSQQYRDKSNSQVGEFDCKNRLRPMYQQDSETFQFTQIQDNFPQTDHNQITESFRSSQYLGETAEVTNTEIAQYLKQAYQMSHKDQKSEQQFQCFPQTMENTFNHSQHPLQNNDKSKVFTRLYNNAERLRLKQERKVLQTDQQIKELSLKATQNLSNKYFSLKRQKSKSKSNISLEQSDFLEKALENNLNRVQLLLEEVQSCGEVKKLQGKFEKDLERLMFAVLKYKSDDKQQSFTTKLGLIKILKALTILQPCSSALPLNQQIFVDELWDFFYVKPLNLKNKQIETDFVHQILRVMLNPLLSIERQAQQLESQKAMMIVIYNEAQIHVVQKEKENELDIQIALALLREIYPNYYDFKHFHRRVDMICERARNKSQLNLAKKIDLQNQFDFHPKVNKNSQLLDKYRQGDRLVQRPCLTSKNSVYHGSTPDFPENDLDIEDEFDLTNKPNLLQVQSHLKIPPTSNEITFSVSENTEDADPYFQESNAYADRLKSPPKSIPHRRHQSDLHLQLQQVSLPQHFETGFQSSRDVTRCQRWEVLYEDAKTSQQSQRSRQASQCRDQPNEAKECTFKPNLGKLTVLLAEHKRQKMFRKASPTLENNLAELKTNERLYVCRDYRNKRIEQMIEIKQIKEDDEFQMMPFRPERPSVLTKGLKDSRQMFAQPKGVDQAVQRLTEGRNLREQIKKSQESFGLNWTGHPTVVEPFEFQTDKREMQKLAEDYRDIVLVIQLLVSHNKTVNISVRKGDSVEALTNAFSKTYSLKQDARQALRQILDRHIKQIALAVNNDLIVQEDDYLLQQDDNKLTPYLEQVKELQSSEESSKLLKSEAFSDFMKLKEIEITAETHKACTPNLIRQSENEDISPFRMKGQKKNMPFKSARRSTVLGAIDLNTAI